MQALLLFFEIIKMARNNQKIIRTSTNPNKKAHPTFKQNSKLNRIKLILKLSYYV